jgi:hypothetical protein
MINWKVFGRKLLWLNSGTLPVFSREAEESIEKFQSG